MHEGDRDASPRHERPQIKYRAAGKIAAERKPWVCLFGDVPCDASVAADFAKPLRRAPPC